MTKSTQKVSPHLTFSPRSSSLHKSSKTWRLKFQTNFRDVVSFLKGLFWAFWEGTCPRCLVLQYYIFYNVRHERTIKCMYNEHFFNEYNGSNLTTTTRSKYSLILTHFIFQANVCVVKHHRAQTHLQQHKISVFLLFYLCFSDDKSFVTWHHFQLDQDQLILFCTWSSTEYGIPVSNEKILFEKWVRTCEVPGRSHKNHHGRF